MPELQADGCSGSWSHCNPGVQKPSFGSLCARAASGLCDCSAGQESAEPAFGRSAAHFRLQHLRICQPPGSDGSESLYEQRSKGPCRGFMQKRTLHARVGVPESSAMTFAKESYGFAKVLRNICRQHIRFQEIPRKHCAKDPR